MSFLWKRRLVMMLLISLAVWPLVHRTLVVRYDLNPWRLFGWAMYCTPIPRVDVGFVPERAGRPVELSLPPDLRGEIQGFTRRSEALGQLADPRGLARTALTTLEIDSLVLTVQRRYLDARSARLVGRRDYYCFHIG